MAHKAMRYISVIEQFAVDCGVCLSRSVGQDWRWYFDTRREADTFARDHAEEHDAAASPASVRDAEGG